MTTEVGRLLQQRTEHLKSIDHSSQWLQEEVSSLAMVSYTLAVMLSRDEILVLFEERDSLPPEFFSLFFFLL